MHPSSRPSVPPRSRRFDNRHIEAKQSHVTKREDKNMNTTSSRRVTRGPPESSRLKGPSQVPRAPVVQAKLVRPQRIGAHAIPAISKPKSGRSVLNPAPAVDPNCNEPSLPCLCCDGHSPQDSNSLFNHNHNNNNTVNIRQQMKLPPPPPPNNDKLAVLKQDVKEDECKLEVKQPHVVPVEEKDEVNGNMDEKDADHLKNVDDGVNVNGNVDVNGNGGNDDEDDDDDTLVPSCGNCPDSMLDFSLTSSTSSSSTSISSCSDLECDCPDTFSLSSQDQEDPEHYQSSHSPATHCPSFESSVLPMDHNPSTRPPISPCSIDEGYPSAPSSPCSDYMDRKGEKGTCIKVNLLNFLDSMEELGKVDLFYRIVKLAHWELDNELIVRDRLDHQQKLQRVNKEVKLAYLLKLQEEGLDFNNEDIPRVLDEMGNIDISWKLYKSNKSCDSQEFSDGGVDLTAPSDLDETPVTDSLSPSPQDLLPPPRPPKPPKRHASAQPESHKYQNISGHVFSVLSTDETTASSTAVSAPTLPTLSSSPSTVKPPALSPPPSKPVPYFTLNTDSSTFTCPTPPIPPPRRRHKARLEAQRLAELEREKIPHTLPPPTSRPPPLPPPPASTTVIPPPPSVPPPPSFHALDVEIRKLLALAGLTQAELLKLSPELGVSVDVVSANEKESISEMSQMGELRVNTSQKEDIENEELDSRLREKTRFEKDKSSSVKCELDVISEKEILKEEQNDTNRTTSFTEMARRRKRNGGNCNHGCGCSYGHNVTLSPNSYYSAGLSNTDIPDVSIGRFEYTSIISDTPPPPPPRPLPPCPALASNSSGLHSLKSSTLPANSTRPDRFDWLIAFTPDTESPPLEMRKVSDDGMLHKTNSGSKVTTFKELRNRSKQGSLPAPSLPEPDPNVVTPDPDFLYNLKWRREKIEGDGWEYTSQAQASFLQPPPTPASLSLFREMCHLNIQDNCPAEPKVFQQIGCSVSEGSLRSICGERCKDDQPKKLEDGQKMEVRGMADGAWTLESRTTVSSPPLSLSTSYSLTSPYYLHSAPLSQASHYYHPDSNRDHDMPRSGDSMNISKPSCINSTFDPSRKYIDYTDSLYWTDSDNNAFFLYNQVNDPNADIDSLYHKCDHENIFIDSLYLYENDSDNKKTNFYSVYNSELDTMKNEDSLYYNEKYTRNTLKLFSDTEPPTPNINTLTEGDITPYKNIDMQSYITMRNLKNQTYANNNTYKDSQIDLPPEPVYSCSDHNSNETTTQNKQDVLSFPAYYLYHPKNCPLHKGEPPRLSPVGAISPPLRPGPPIPGTDVPHLCSPLFPRSHTLPALAAPLYYPYLYTPPVQAPLREPSVSILHSQQTPPPHTLTVRSFSFAGSEQKKATWMGDDARPSVKTEGLSSACLQEKRTLVSSVSLAVEAILAQFNSSRTLVQKALSGDSSVNPTLGRLVLQCLCPALRSLLCDGLKPHQSDLIAGRRPNSPWALVQASTKPGPSTQALHNLQAKVAGLPQLKHSRHRFNAFLFGLLNNKLLDYWLSHLHSCCDVLETFYRPMSFMRLSLTSCKPLFEELVILLQPLSLLTFNLDLLFQHHHLDHASPTLTPASHSSDIRSPPNENFSFYLSPKGLFQGSDHHLGRVLKQDHSILNSNAGLTSLSSHALDMFEESTCRNPFLGANKDEASSPLSWLKENDVSGILASGGSGASLSQQAGQALQQGWGAVMRLGERLGQNFGLASSSSSEDVKGPLDDQKTGFLLHRKSPVENRQQPREDLSLWDCETAVPWNLGRLFGASKSPNNPPTSRRPSQWLSPGVSVLTRIANLGQDTPSENCELQRNTDKEKDENQSSKETRDQPMPLRVVRTLCDYKGTRGELSFRKGEELVLLGDVDHDWIKCLQGDKEGLVPIGYASLVM
ncbi:uncharacterized protein rusc1 isoform X2 [Triplophysa dalaica]|uniref:uncharacterized protein rusc1 isoform X2 n=1 Tax=Triplophysa dalaica TaxID=1582913 RepID=UPI0024DF3E1A|nr:uncharacterized protein rusc1 isoform X2 [Triplophysa dalaica]